MLDILDRSHITFKPKNKELESIDVYYSPGFRKYTVFEIGHEEVIGSSAVGFKDVGQHILDTVDATNVETEANLEFHRGKKWDVSREERLQRLLEDCKGSDDFIFELLLMLLH